MPQLQPWIIANNAKRYDTDWVSTLEGHEPVVLFMGGLLHLNDSANGATLFNRLELMAGLEANPTLGVRLISLSEKDPDDDSIKNNLQARQEFNDTGKISSHAQEITDNFILPSSVTGDLTGETLINAVKTHFSRINLIGFSAGTSMIQQCEAICQSRLTELGLSDDDISSTLNALMAFSIGPVSFPNEKKSGFAKMLVILEGDNIAKKARDWSPYTDPAKPNDMAVTSCNRSIVLSDCAGDTQERGLQIIPSTIPGIPGSYKVILKHDGEGHSVFVYTNTRELVQGKNTMTYASSPSAIVGRKFFEKMVFASIDATKKNKPRDGQYLLERFQEQHLSVRHLKDLIAQYHFDRKEFESLIVTSDPYASYKQIAANIEKLKKSPPGAARAGTPPKP